MDKWMDRLGLGALLKEPIAVNGGLLHKMYRVTTSEGEFAVKALNPEIMKRPDALAHMVHSERIAKAFGKWIPLIASFDIAGHQVQMFEGDYYMVFPWLDGVSVFADRITREHCEKIGDILGIMHQKDLQIEGVVPEEDGYKMFDWESYLHRIHFFEDSPKKWISAYKDALEDIKEWNRKACTAGEWLSRRQVISHRDLDPKNTLWKEEFPFVIDWEAAGYVNPFQEFLEVVHYWADDGMGGLVKEKFDGLVGAYCKHMDLRDAKWDAVLDGSCIGVLGWLEYNIKRALGLEASDANEIALGEEQVLITIHELYHYQERAEKLREWLSSQFTQYPS